MIFEDKSAGEPRVSETLLSENSDSFSFTDMVDDACERLKDRQIKYSIRRIAEMEECLYNLEKELDAFLEKAIFLLQKEG
jgi:hypothetical protein